MWKLLCLAVLLALTGCGNDGDESEGLPSWLDQFDANISTSTTIDGRDVYVDDESKTVYVKGGCDNTEEGLTQSGDPYGPTDDTPGYATICVD